MIDALPDYSIKGSLENGGQLTIRNGPIVCSVKLFVDKYLCYTFRASLKDFRVIIPLFIFPVLLTLLLWYILDAHFGQKAKVVRAI